MDNKQQLLFQLLDMSKELMFVVDMSLQVDYVNDCFCQTLEYEAQDIIGSSILAFFSHQEIFAQLMRFNLHNTLKEQTTAITKTGNEIILDVVLSPIYDNRGVLIAVLGKGSNLVTKEVFDKELHKAAYTDCITGFGNRKLLFDKLDAFFESYEHTGDKYLCLGIDFENMQDIDDVYGYYFGNEVLQLTTKKLSNQCGLDDIVVRVSGNELVVLHKYTDEAAAHHWAQQTVNQFNKPVQISDGRKIDVHINVGAAFFPTDAQDSLTGLKYVELAYNKALALPNDNCVFFNKEMAEEFLYRLNIEKELRQAIANDEFELFYQPKLHLPERTVYGFEALIRWHNPERGLLTPQSFLQVAEDTKLIVDIGIWVFTQACKQQVLWAQQGCYYKISINVSIIQMRAEDFIERISTILEETGAIPNYIELELTESVFIENIQRINVVLKKIKELGLSISLDDFGTGYSSLSYLGEIPIDALKIDRSFIKNMLSNTKVAAITRSILDLSKNLSLQIVAEGTEREEQVNFLEEINCRCVQGFYFYHPMPVKEIEKICF